MSVTTTQQQLSSLSYPGWKEDVDAAQRLAQTRDRCLQEKLMAMNTRQKLFEGDRSHPHLKTLDATHFDYKGWHLDKLEAERRLSGDCSVLQLGSYNAFYQTMLKKQALSTCRRSSIPCIYELDQCELTYTDWQHDKATAEQIYLDYSTPVRFHAKLQAMKNKQRLFEGDRSHADIVALDTTTFTYEDAALDRRDYLKRHVGDCTVLQLGVSCEYWWQRMLKKQQLHEGHNPKLLEASCGVVFTYPEWKRDQQQAQTYYANFSSSQHYQLKMTAMKNKQRLHDGDRTHPNIVALDTTTFTYEGWAVDKQQALDRHTGDCTVLQLGTFAAMLKSMKQKQQEHEAAAGHNNNNNPRVVGLGDLDALLPPPVVEAATQEEEGEGEHDKKCVVCCEREPSHAFIPCGHLVVCSHCTPHFEEDQAGMACPICRQPAHLLTKIIIA